MKATVKMQITVTPKLAAWLEKEGRVRGIPASTQAKILLSETMKETEAKSSAKRPAAS